MESTIQIFTGAFQSPTELGLEQSLIISAGMELRSILPLLHSGSKHFARLVLRLAFLPGLFWKVKSSCCPRFLTSFYLLKMCFGFRLFWSILQFWDSQQKTVSHKHILLLLTMSLTWFSKKSTNGLYFLILLHPWSISMFSVSASTRSSLSRSGRSGSGTLVGGNFMCAWQASSAEI